MSIRENIVSYSKGDYLCRFWRLFRWRQQCSNNMIRRIMTFFLNRMACQHGGYVGYGAIFDSIPMLPHGLHGVYISRYARIGANCCIYQNVTIGEVNRIAPQIGNRCLIGAGAVIIGNIKIGDDVKIGAGAVVCTDIPSHATVVAPPSRILVRRAENG